MRGIGGVSALKPPPPPPQEHLPRWRRAMEGLRHSMTRDAEAIHHHYDVSNEFYRHVLGPSMAYTCAVYPEGSSTLDTAWVRCSAHAERRATSTISAYASRAPSPYER